MRAGRGAEGLWGLRRTWEAIGHLLEGGVQRLERPRGARVHALQQLGGHITPLHEGQQEQPVNDYKCVPTLSPVMQVLTPSQVRRAATLAAARWALGRARRALQQAGYEVEWCHESAVGSKRQRQSAADALESSLRY